MDFLDDVLGRPSYAFLASLAITIALLPISIFGAKWWSNSSSKRYKRRIFRRLKNVTGGIYRAKDNYAAYDAAYVSLRIIMITFALFVLVALSATMIQAGKNEENESWSFVLRWAPLVAYIPLVIYLNTKMVVYSRYLKDMINPYLALRVIRREINGASSDILTESDAKLLKELVDLMLQHVPADNFINDDLRRVLALKVKLKI